MFCVQLYIERSRCKHLQPSRRFIGRDLQKTAPRSQADTSTDGKRELEPGHYHEMVEREACVKPLLEIIFICSSYRICSRSISSSWSLLPALPHIENRSGALTMCNLKKEKTQKFPVCNFLEDWKQTFKTCTFVSSIFSIDFWLIFVLTTQCCQP